MSLSKEQCFRKLVRNLRTQNVPALARIQTRPRGKWLMNKEEVVPKQVFKDGDHRVANPYFTVWAVRDGKATGIRLVDIEGTKTHNGKIPFEAKISLDRLIKTGTRGYTLVKGVNPEPQAPAATTEPAPETAPV